MKKKLLTLTALGAVCALTAVAGACSAGGGDSSTQTPERARVVTIADFEEWAPSFQLIRTGQTFGAIHVNKDLAYVKSGKQSALLHPMGAYRNGSTPIMFFPSYSKEFDIDYADFSDADKITFQFYNAEATPVNVAVGLVQEVKGIENINRTSLDYQPLQPGWNEVTYTVNVSALAISCDVTAIDGVFVAFENTNSRDEADAPDIYLDDVVLYRKEQAEEIQDLVQLAQNEYADFEQDWQQYVITVRSTPYTPDVNLVNAADYKVGEAPAEGEADTRPALTALSGSRVLRLLAKQGQDPAATYPGITYSGALLQRSMFSSLKEADYGRVTFKMNFFNNSPTPQRMGIMFYDANGKKRLQYTIEGLPSYEWYTFSINVKKLYEDWQDANPKNKELFTNPGHIHVFWPEFTQPDKEIFMDNLHFEVEERDTTVAPVINLAPFARVAKLGDKIELPVARVTDKYDISGLTCKMKPYFYDESNSAWEEVALDSGLVPIAKIGNYKLIATATNSLGNTTTQEVFFKGVESVPTNMWSGYDFEDEKSTIVLDGEVSDTNKTEWLESVTLGGETREGVVKASTDNATDYGAGYFGMRFANEYLTAAEKANWAYFYIDAYIEAELPTIKLYSWNQLILDNVPTGKWVTLKISKALLNTGKTYVNRTGSAVQDFIFYEDFNAMCGFDCKALLYTTSIKKKSADSKVVIYFDKVTWEGVKNGAFGEGDDGADDIYTTPWADPFRKEYY